MANVRSGPGGHALTTAWANALAPCGAWPPSRIGPSGARMIGLTNDRSSMPMRSSSCAKYLARQAELTFPATTARVTAVELVGDDQLVDCDRLWTTWVVLPRLVKPLVERTPFMKASELPPATIPLAWHTDPKIPARSVAEGLLTSSWRPLASRVVLAFLLGGCGTSGSSSSSGGSSGGTATGGTSTGGQGVTGNGASGGSVSTGGATATGGITGTGGVTATGGTHGQGGVQGGVAGAASGGAGGMSGAGGTAAGGSDDGGAAGVVGSAGSGSIAGAVGSAGGGAGDGYAGRGGGAGGAAGQDGGFDSAPGLPGCKGNADCGSGEMCLFAVGSCSARGECRDVNSLGPLCNIVVTYCGCDGQTIGGLCGPDYAYAATLGEEGPCGPTPTVAQGASLSTLAQLTQSVPEFIAIDATSVYFTATLGGRVVKVPIGGGAPVVLAAGQSEPTGIVVDAANVYWTNQASNSGNSIMKVPIGGGAPITLASGQGAPFGIAVDAKSVYWTNLSDNHAVMKVAIDGGAPTVLSAATSPWAIVVRESSVYFTDGDDVMMVPAAGGNAVPLATAQEFPFSLAVDATNLYWSSGRGAGAIVKLPLPGGTPTTLASGTGLARIAVDATNVYFTSPNPSAPNDGTVVRVPIAGGATTTLVNGQSSPEGIAVDGHSVYWVDTGLGAVMSLTPK